MCSGWPKTFYGDNYPLHLKKQQIQVIVKVGFFGNILFWPYLMQFLPVSLQNRLKMCAFLRDNENRLQPVHTNPVVCSCVQFFYFRKARTANWRSGCIAVQSGPVSVFFQLRELNIQTLLESSLKKVFWW